MWNAAVYKGPKNELLDTSRYEDKHKYITGPATLI